MNDRAAGDGRMAKHSLVIAGHRTSISLEDAFWRALKEIAAERGQSLAGLVAEIDSTRGDANLSSAIRVFVLAEARAAKHL
jgi:predicted DNA-binding ribbon-helix-helix protein